MGYLIQGVASGVTAWALAAGAPTPVIYACAAVATAAITLTRPVHLAVLPELAESPRQLTAANTLSSTIEGLSVFAGPLIAGALLQVSGTWAVFAAAAVGLTAAGALLLAVQARGQFPTEDRNRLSGALEGFRELRRRPGARLLLGFVAGQTAVIGALDVLTVVLAFSVLAMGPSGPGFLSAAVGIGGLVGAAATVTLIGRDRLSSPFFLGVLGVGVPIALMALVPGPAAALVLLSFSGVGRSFFDVAARTLLQRSVDGDVLARVFGVQEGLNMAAFVVGSVVAPVLVAVLGERAAFAAVGLTLPLIAVLAVQRIRRVDRDAVTVPPEDLELLRHTPVFGPLGPVALERLGRGLIAQKVPEGTVVIREGDPGDRFYVIADGAVAVTKEGQPVATLGAGESFGEIALLMDVPRTATVTATTPCDLRALERGLFLSALTGSPTSQRAAHQEAGRRLAALGDLEEFDDRDG